MTVKERAEHGTGGEVGAGAFDVDIHRLALKIRQRLDFRPRADVQVVLVKFADVLDLAKFTRIEMVRLRKAQCVGRDQSQIHARQMQQIPNIL